LTVAVTSQPITAGFTNVLTNEDTFLPPGGKLAEHLNQGRELTRAPGPVDAPDSQQSNISAGDRNQENQENQDREQGEPGELEEQGEPGELEEQ